MILKIRNRKKGIIERTLQALIDVLGSLAEVIFSVDDYAGLGKKIDQIISIEIEFETAFQELNDHLKNRFYAPFYWEDLYSIGVCLRKMFKLLVVYHNKRLIYKNKISYKCLLSIQLEIFNNMKGFFREYLDNKKYAHEVLKSIRYLAERYQRLYLDIVKTSIHGDTARFGIIEIGEVLEKLIEENENSHHLMNKILIGIA